jgi:hypothetical protein
MKLFNRAPRGRNWQPLVPGVLTLALSEKNGYLISGYVVQVSQANVH